jgi:hypothetical protein
VSRARRYTPTASFSLCRVLSMSSPCVAVGSVADGDLAAACGASTLTCVADGDRELRCAAALNGGGDRLSCRSRAGENEREKRLARRGSGLVVGCVPGAAGCGVRLPLLRAHTGIAIAPSACVRAVCMHATAQRAALRVHITRPGATWRSCGIQCTHTMHAYNARIQCTHTMHAYNARIQCTHTMQRVLRRQPLTRVQQRWPHCGHRVEARLS